MNKKLRSFLPSLVVIGAALMILVAYELLHIYLGNSLQALFKAMFGTNWIKNTDALLGNPVRYASFDTFYNRVAHLCIALLLAACFYLLAGADQLRKQWGTKQFASIDFGALWSLLWMIMVIGFSAGTGYISFQSWDSNIFEKLILYIPFFFLNTFAEELIFRGIIQSVLLQQLKPAWAITISTLFFSGVHYAGITHFGISILCSSFLLGLIMGLIAYSYQTFLASFGFHFVNNYLFNRLVSNNGSIVIVQGIVPFWVTALMSLILFSIILYATKNRRSLLTGSTVV